LGKRIIVKNLDHQVGKKRKRTIFGKEGITKRNKKNMGKKNIVVHMN